MERKNTLLLTVIAIATLLVAVVGATFAYFATQLSQESNGLNVLANTEPASAIFLASGSDLTLTVEGSNMQRSQTDATNAVLSNSNSTTLNVTYGAASSGNALSCTYDIVFKWTGSGDSYLYSAADTHPTDGWVPFNKEFTLSVGTATVSGWNGTETVTTTGAAERNIAMDGTCANASEEPVEAATREACVATEGNVWTEGNVMTLVRGAQIYSNTAYVSTGSCSAELTGEVTEAACTGAGGQWTPAGGGTVVSWPITISFYNLPLDQNGLAGKSFAGRVEVANVVC